MTTDDPVVVAIREVFRKHGQRLRTKLFADYTRPQPILERYWAATIEDLKTLPVPKSSHREITPKLKEMIRAEWLGPFHQDDETIREMVEDASAAIRPKVVRRSYKRTKHDGITQKLEQAMRDAIKLGLKGDEFCAYLDEQNSPRPLAWIGEGCPKGYVAAYRQKKWSKRITKYKNRVARKMQAAQ